MVNMYRLEFCNLLDNMCNMQASSTAPTTEQNYILPASDGTH
jgi:hypothetical protein